MEGTLPPMVGVHRWKIRKMQRKLEEDLLALEKLEAKSHAQQRARTDRIIKNTFDKLYLAVRCAIPSLLARHEALVIAYCTHIIRSPDRKFPEFEVLQAFNRRCQHSPQEKSCAIIVKIYERLLVLCLNRDQAERDYEASTDARRDKQRVQSENKVRWAVDKSLDNGLSKVRYWTLWFLAIHGMAREAQNMLRGDKHWKDDVDKRDPDFGFTALHYASKHGQLELIRLLAQHGADVHATLPDGRSSLHLAATYSNAEVVTELLVEGAHIHAVDSYGYTALDLARQNNNVPAIQVLERWVPVKDSLQPPKPAPTRTTDSEVEPPTERARSAALVMTEERLSKMKVAIESAPETIDAASLRLFEKHACLCLAEGFNADALESVEARFDIARRMYLRELGAALSLASCVAIGEELVSYLAKEKRPIDALRSLDAVLHLFTFPSSPLADSHLILQIKLLSWRVEIILSIPDAEEELLVASLHNLDDALSICKRIYSFLLGEPIEAIPILTLECAVLERLKRYHDAVCKAGNLAVVHRRHFGVHHPATIRSRLSHIRVHIIFAVSLFETQERMRSFRSIDSIAQALLADMQLLNQDNPEAFGMIKRCAEYMALCQLLVAGKYDEVETFGLFFL